MAVYYIYSGASGSANGSSWTNAYTTIAGALTSKAAGDIFYVANDHSESTASAVTWTFPGTSASPNQLICVNRSGSVPPVSADLAATGVATTTGTSNLTISGVVYIQGMVLNIGTGAGAALLAVSGIWAYLKNCQINKPSTGVAAHTFGTTSAEGEYVLDNTSFSWGATMTSGIADSRSSKLTWKNTATPFNGVAGANLPTTLINYTLPSPIKLINLDLSSLGSGKTLFTVTAPITAQIINCKLGSSVTIATSDTKFGGADIRVINSDSSNTITRAERYAPEGIETTELTIIKSGGASNGTTGFSRKMASSSLASYYSPLASMPIVVWNDITGSSKNVAVNIVNDGTTLTNADVWIEVDYNSDASFPDGLTAFDGVADILAAGSNQTSDSTSTWTTTGLTTPIKQTLDVSFTPQQKGWFYIRVMLAKASKTIYVDPFPTVT